MMDDGVWIGLRKADGEVTMKVRAHDRVARRSRGELGVCGGACDWVVEDDEECADVSQSGRSCVVCRVSIFGGVMFVFVFAFVFIRAYAVCICCSRIVVRVRWKCRAWRIRERQ